MVRPIARLGALVTTSQRLNDRHDGAFSNMNVSVSQSPDSLGMPIPEDGGIITSLHQACSEVLASVISTKSAVAGFSDAQKRSLRRTQESLLIWGDRHDVAKGILDMNLQGSPHLMRMVVKLLSSAMIASFHGMCCCILDHAMLKL